MTVETSTNEGDGPRASPVTIRLPMLLLLVAALVCFGVYLSVRTSTSKVTVWGQLSTHDVEAIRRGVAHWRYKELGDGISHLRWGMVWDEVRLLRSCPLESIVSKDGRTGFATCHGRVWNGHYRSITYMFTNNAGVWSGTTRSFSEGSR